MRQLREDLFYLMPQQTSFFRRETSFDKRPRQSYTADIYDQFEESLRTIDSISGGMIAGLGDDDLVVRINHRFSKRIANAL